LRVTDSCGLSAMSSGATTSDGKFLTADGNYYWGSCPNGEGTCTQSYVGCGSQTGVDYCGNPVASCSSDVYTSSSCGNDVATSGPEQVTASCYETGGAVNNAYSAGSPGKTASASTNYWVYVYSPGLPDGPWMSALYFNESYSSVVQGLPLC
jgi:hypothetical protein